MKPEEQRIAIAEACGWKFIPEYYHGEDQPPEFTTVTPEGKHLCGHYPDYLNDLNTAHAAVLELVGGDIGRDLDARHRLRVFVRLLMVETNPRYAPDWPDCDSYSSFSVLHLMLGLSADKICEALLRTLNLWKP
jgi:hypothetical protein